MDCFDLPQHQKRRPVFMQIKETAKTGIKPPEDQVPVEVLCRMSYYRKTTLL